MELFGKKYPKPLLMATVDANKIFHHDREPGNIRACADCSVPHIMGIAASIIYGAVPASRIWLLPVTAANGPD